MGLRPGESPALTQIESQLAKSDPALAAMLAVFTADPPRARDCSRPTAPPRAKRVAVLILLAAFFALSVSMAAIAAP